MRVIKKLFIFLGLIIAIALILLFSREYFIKKPEKKVYLEEGTEEEIIEKKEVSISTPTEQLLEEKKEELTPPQKPILLFNFPILFPLINYPEIYGYDPQSKTIRAYNIEEKNYQELYKDENINYALFSKNGLLLYIKTANNHYLINRATDKKYILPYFTQKALFKENNFYIFVSDLTGSSYLAEFDAAEKKLFDISILNPDIDFLNNGILIAENLKSTPASPLYFKNNNDTKLFLSPKSYLSFITNKNNLAFISYFDQSWKSILIDNQNNIKKEFNFGTLKEKCTFDNILICGVPKNQEVNKINNWYYLKEVFNDDLIIYDPNYDTFKVIKLDDGFDIIKPQLTPLGIIFLNRNDSLIYLLSKDNFSL